MFTFELALSKIIYYTSLANEHNRRNFSLQCVDDAQRASNSITVIISSEPPHPVLDMLETTTLSNYKMSRAAFTNSSTQGDSQESNNSRNNLKFVAAPKSLHARRVLVPSDPDILDPEVNTEIKTFDIFLIGMLTILAITLVVGMIFYSIYRHRIYKMADQVSEMEER